MTRLLAGLGLAGIALFMLSGFFGAGIDRSDPATLAALGLAVGLPALGAVLLLHNQFRDRHHLGARRAALRAQTIESEILKLAVANSGRLTAVEVATHLALSPEAATEALDRLALRSQAAYEVTDAGVIVYSFHDIIHLDGKHTARGVLDD